jgi:hypothetical protein
MLRGNNCHLAILHPGKLSYWSTARIKSRGFGCFDEVIAKRLILSREKNEPKRKK